MIGKIFGGYKITVTNKQGRYLIDMPMKLLIKSAVTAALRHECIPENCYPAQVSVSIVNDRQIRRLNRRHRGIDRSTDVLSFPLLEGGIPTVDDIDPVTDTIPIGDIVLSMEHARRQAVLYGHPLCREVAFLCVHSVLHLLGYDHMTEEDEAIMLARQEEILHEMGLDRDGIHLPPRFDPTPALSSLRRGLVRTAGRCGKYIKKVMKTGGCDCDPK